MLAHIRLLFQKAQIQTCLGHSAKYSSLLVINAFETAHQLLQARRLSKQILNTVNIQGCWKPMENPFGFWTFDLHSSLKTKNSKCVFEASSPIGCSRYRLTVPLSTLSQNKSSFVMGASCILLLKIKARIKRMDMWVSPV